MLGGGVGNSGDSVNNGGIKMKDVKIGDELNVEFIAKVVGIKEGLTGEIMYEMRNIFNKSEYNETAFVRGTRLYPLVTPEDIQADQDHKYEQARAE